MEEALRPRDILHEVLLQQRVVQQSQGVLALRDAIPVVHAFFRYFKSLSTRISQLRVLEVVQGLPKNSLPRRFERSEHEYAVGPQQHGVLRTDLHRVFVEFLRTD